LKTIIPDLKLAPTCPLTKSKLAWGAKLQQKANLEDELFFLEGQNHNFEKLKVPKV